jgi:hypothetical protein
MKPLVFPIRLARWLALVLLLGGAGGPGLALPPGGPLGTDPGEDDRPVGSLPIVTFPAGPDLAAFDLSRPTVSVVFPTPTGGTIRFLGPTGQTFGPSLPVPPNARAVRVDLPGGVADQVTGIVLVTKHGKSRVVWTR